MKAHELIGYLNKFSPDAEVTIGVKIELDGIAKKFGTEIVIAEDSTDDTVWLDMHKAVHVITSSPSVTIK